MAGKYSVKLDNLTENNSHRIIIENIRPGSFVLECGCAQGYMTRYMKEKLQCKVCIIEYNNEDFRIASEFAEDGICANLEENTWFEYYENKKFDVILFSDVLEHLRNPQEVLNLAVTLLKDNGIIIMSIPNIGHSDILINLINNRWNYRSLGLLDNTHIHFWAEKNLDEFCANAGLSIIIKDYTILPAYHTEQSSTDSPDEMLPAINVICQRKFEDVYQFVYFSQKSQYVAKHSIECKDFYEQRHARYGAIPQIVYDFQQKHVEFSAEKKLLEYRIQEQAAHITTQKDYITALTQSNEEIKEQLSEAQQEISELKDYKREYVVALNHIDDLRRHIAQIEALYNSINNSVFWKITWPLRRAKRTAMKIHPINVAINRCKYLKKNGIRKTIQLIQDNHKHHVDFLSVAWSNYTQNQLNIQRNEHFSRDVRISIVVPLHNTPIKALNEMISSVMDQTYANWELCLVDTSDKRNALVGWTCRRLEKRESRIRYRRSNENPGTSSNINSCIDMATGEYIAFLDSLDLLHPAALYEVIIAILRKGADFVYTDEVLFHEKPDDAYCPLFKSDYAPDSIRGTNYIGRLMVFKSCLLNSAGQSRPDYEGNQEYDLLLRLTEQADSIVHIPKALYYRKVQTDFDYKAIATESQVIEAGRKALSDHLERMGLKGEVMDACVPSIYRIKYELTSTPLVSILIPNYEHKEELETCLNSIFELTTYTNYEIIIIENNSQSREIFDYYENIKKQRDNIKVVRWEKEFNYSAINNFGASFASGEHLLLLNNDIKVITPDWIQEMLMFSQRSDVGAVGVKLYYPDNTVQHAGVIIGIGGVAGHCHRYYDRYDHGYMNRLVYAQDLSAVTAACLMLRRSVWNEVNGLDESFEVAFNDVDFCMRIRKRGYLIVWTPFAELYHCESKSRGLDDSPKKRRRYMSEVHRFQDRWAKELADGDPYYNPNLSQIKEDFSLKE